MPHIVKHRCPHLGLENDPVTWFAFPTGENYCHQRRSPRAIETSYQRDFCLSENYIECPLLASQKQAEPAPETADEEEQEPERPHRRLMPWVWGALILAVIGGAVFVFGGPLWGQAAPAPALPTGTLTLQLTEIPTAALDPAVMPTAIVSPTATIEPTLELTTALAAGPSPAATDMMVLALAFDSYVRAGPGRGFATVAYIPAGTLVTVLGRDLDGFWLWVRLDDGREGWVAITQFTADAVDLKAIPIAPEIPTPGVTATPGM